MKTITLTKNNALNNILETNQKNYPIKEFLLTHSYLVQFNEKEANGKALTKVEKVKRNRIYELRIKIFLNISQEIKRYYETVIPGDYRFDGMPEISNGIRGWIEHKICRLLVKIGEPNNLRYKNDEDDFWAEA